METKANNLSIFRLIKLRRIQIYTVFYLNLKFILIFNKTGSDKQL